MGLETPTYISDLNSAWPLGADGKNTADDHLRNLKAAVKATFPNVTGAVTATHTQLNAVVTNGAAVASTSGTAIDFTGIPSWVKRITVSFVGVSTNGTNSIHLQIGDSGGIEVLGYQSVAPFNSGYGVKFSPGAADTLDGAIQLVLADASTNTWTAFGVIVTSGTSAAAMGGSKSLSATLDRVRVTTLAGTDTFDAGKINIQYD